MNLPKYEEIIENDLKETTRRIIQFDKVPSADDQYILVDTRSLMEFADDFMELEKKQLSSM